MTRRLDHDRPGRPVQQAFTGLPSMEGRPVTEFGYALSSEEHAPNDLVRYAQRAEATGFSFAAISDHFHPWVDQQGHAPFVWSVLGAIAHATSTLKLGTGVTCPTV